MNSNLKGIFQPKLSYEKEIETLKLCSVDFLICIIFSYMPCFPKMKLPTPLK